MLGYLVVCRQLQVGARDLAHDIGVHHARGGGAVVRLKVGGGIGRCGHLPARRVRDRAGRTENVANGRGPTGQGMVGMVDGSHSDVREEECSKVVVLPARRC